MTGDIRAKLGVNRPYEKKTENAKILCPFPVIPLEYAAYRNGDFSFLLTYDLIGENRCIDEVGGIDLKCIRNIVEYLKRKTVCCTRCFD